MTVFIELEDKQKQATAQELLHEVERRVYAAVTKACEEAEVQQLIFGDGHHLAQKITALATLTFRERIEKRHAADGPPTTPVSTNQEHIMSQPTITLKSSSGAEVVVPCSLPHSVGPMPCYVSGLGVREAYVNLTSRAPEKAEVGSVEVYDPEDPGPAALRPAEELAADMLERALKGLLEPSETQQSTVLRHIADMALAERATRAAYDALPDRIRKNHAHNMRPKSTLTAYGTLADDLPSAYALTTYVDSLFEEALEWAEEKAKALRQDAWLAEEQRRREDVADGRADLK